MTPFPNVREAPGCECDDPFLGDILREYAGTREGGLRATDYPEDANTLRPEVGVRNWRLKSLREGSAGCSGYAQAAHLIEDINEGESVVTLERHGGIHTLLRCQHLGEGV